MWEIVAGVRRLSRFGGHARSGGRDLLRWEHTIPGAIVRNLSAGLWKDRGTVTSQNWEEYEFGRRYSMETVQQVEAEGMQAQAQAQQEASQQGQDHEAIEELLRLRDAQGRPPIQFNEVPQHDAVPAPVQKRHPLRVKAWGVVAVGVAVIAAWPVLAALVTPSVLPISLTMVVGTVGLRYMRKHHLLSPKQWKNHVAALRERRALRKQQGAEEPTMEQNAVDAPERVGTDEHTPTPEEREAMRAQERAEEEAYQKEQEQGFRVRDNRKLDPDLQNDVRKPWKTAAPADPAVAAAPKAAVPDVVVKGQRGYYRSILREIADAPLLRQKRLLAAAALLKTKEDVRSGGEILDYRWALEQVQGTRRLDVAETIARGVLELYPERTAQKSAEAKGRKGAGERKAPEAVAPEKVTLPRVRQGADLS